MFLDENIDTNSLDAMVISLIQYRCNRITMFVGNSSILVGQVDEYQLSDKLYYLVNIIVSKQLRHLVNTYVERIVVAPVDNCSFLPNDKRLAFFFLFI